MFMEMKRQNVLQDVVDYCDKVIDFCDKVHNFCDRLYIKLIIGTHHDAVDAGPVRVVNPHKILGFSALAHFLYRYWLIVTTGTAQFSGTSWDLFWLVGHMTLSLSSFLFPVRKNRLFDNQIIWRELQLHNIVFTARSCLIFAYQIYYPGQNIWSRFVIVMWCHVMADVVTFLYKEGSTMRDMTCDNQIVTQDIKRHLDKFYALSQFAATAALIIPTAHTFEHATMIMFSIQLSTFLMTLRLKGIINNDMWHMFYTASLLMNFHVANICYNPDKYHYLSVVMSLFYVWRVVLRGNKYLGWFFLIWWYDFIMNNVMNHVMNASIHDKIVKDVPMNALVPYYVPVY